MFDFALTFFLVFLGYYYFQRRFASAQHTSHMPLVMNRRGGRVMPGHRRPPPTVGPARKQSEEPPSAPAVSSEGGPYDPDLDDVITVKDMLRSAGNLPDEIILQVMDEAEYWACSSASVDYTPLQRGYLSIRGTQNENEFLLRTEPLAMSSWVPDRDDAWQLPSAPRHLREEYTREQLEEYRDERLESTLVSPCRKIVFNIQSNDQGWGGGRGDKGTYHGAYTWFDAGLERFDAKPDGREAQNGSHLPLSALRPIWPKGKADVNGQVQYDHELFWSPEHTIKCNKVAIRETQAHHVEWRYTDDIDAQTPEGDDLKAAGRGEATGSGEFVRNMKFGDVVTVWGRARFGGWENQVKKVEVKVYWAV
ncbi:hypothetical protein JX266_008793 [Neoarthrinium moseri]|nr:hypothetical protein JX266_008793 [Neoarthrinium moseri]